MACGNLKLVMGKQRWDARLLWHSIDEGIKNLTEVGMLVWTYYNK